MSNSTNPSTPTAIGNSQSNSTQKRKQNTRSSFPKGRSKYAKKARSNFKKAPIAAKPKGPVNTYTSVCCSVPAVKKPCVAVNKKDALTQTLGKFRCSSCKKRCKVTVSKFKPAEALTQEGWKPADEVKQGDTVRAVIPASTPVAYGTVEGADLGRGTAILESEVEVRDAAN